MFRLVISNMNYTKLLIIVIKLNAPQLLLPSGDQTFQMPIKVSFLYVYTLKFKQNVLSLGILGFAIITSYLNKNWFR